MRKKLLMVFGLAAMLTAFVALPAIAQAQAMLESVREGGNQILEKGDQLGFFNYNEVSFKGSTGIEINCEENELTAQVTENPGAEALVEDEYARFEGGGAGYRCPSSVSGVTAAISSKSPIAIKFSLAGEGTADMTGVALEFQFYAGGSVTADCQYAGELHGEFPLTTPLDYPGALSLTEGNLELTSGSGNCPKAMTVSGGFEGTALGASLEVRDE